MGYNAICKKSKCRARDDKRGGVPIGAERGGVGEAPPPRLETAAQSPRPDAIRRLAAALGCPVLAPLMDEDDDAV